MMIFFGVRLNLICLVFVLLRIIRLMFQRFVMIIQRFVCVVTVVLFLFSCQTVKSIYRAIGNFLDMYDIDQLLSCYNGGKDMDLKVFVMVNKPFQSVEGVFCAPSFSLAVRDNFQSWLNMYPNLLEDYEVYQVGIVAREVPAEPTVTLSSHPILCNWSNFEKEMHYVPQMLSDRQKQIMAQQNSQMIEQLTALQDRVEKLNYKQQVNKPVETVVDGDK